MSTAFDREALESQVLLREELVRRRADDPWFDWQPTEKQIPFIKSILCGEVDEAFMICANRAGKSDAAAYIGSGLARFGRKNPKYQITHGGDLVVENYATAGWVISVDYPNSRDVIQPKYFDNGMSAGSSHRPFIPAREIEGKFNVTDQILRLKNGSIIGFKSADTKAIKFAGASRDWIHIDEECPKAIYDEATIRISGGNKDGKGRGLLVFGACTLLPPEGQVGGITWMYDEFIKPWQRDPASCRFRLFRASIYDNPHLNKEDIARLESKYPVGSVERKIRLDGEWLPGLQGARAYGSFDSLIHVRPQPEIIPRRPLVWTLDFNVEPMVSLICQRENDLFRVYRELILETGSIDEMVQYFHEAAPSHHGEVWIYGDATGNSRSGQTGRSYYQLILNLMRTYGSPCRLKVPEANPKVPDRINAVNRMLRDEQGVARIEIDPSCNELIDDLEQVLRDARGGIKKTHNRKEPYFRRTHTSDAFGYWINYEEPVRATVMQRIGRAIRGPSYAFRPTPR